MTHRINRLTAIVWMVLLYPLVLILRHRGAEVSRFVNTMSADEVRPSIAAVAGEAGAAADDGA